MIPGLRRSVAEAARNEELGNPPEALAPAGNHVCPVCGVTVKAADLGASLFHQRPNHRASDRLR
jgi:hypothetical protein